MWTINVKDRGRTLAYHQVDTYEEARELQQVYLSLGYAPEKITIAWVGETGQEAA